ncbi:MAG: RNA 2',3'-cyclic phosphodiesterase [Gallionella sp.]|nr:RNA 2',3'-cyclic phosphodiesterase [Gallionella sp.]
MDTQPDTVRVFFALWPTKAEQSALDNWQVTLKATSGGRVMRADTLHVTLVFLGDVDAARLEALKLAAAEVRAQRFALDLDEARYWGHNHVVYAAPRLIAPQLAVLVSRLEQNLIRHRFEFEQRAYTPHVTLLRNARDEPLPEMKPVRWQVREFVLLQSAPHNGGVQYRVMARFPLV